MPQLHEYFDQNWSVDHKNTRNHYNQAAEAVITTNSLRDIFSGTPCSTTCSKNQIRHKEALLERGWCMPTFVRIQIVEASSLLHFSVISSKTASDDLSLGSLKLVLNPRHVHVQYFFGCWTAHNLLLRIGIFTYLWTYTSKVKASLGIVKVEGHLWRPLSQLQVRLEKVLSPFFPGSRPLRRSPSLELGNPLPDVSVPQVRREIGGKQES